ncbi:MAG: hypothetical protein J0L82_10335 [Deltaproteobacteria bacterium]|nr:hypothetical protein [Deltaproteobacteria bacterium]
MPTDEELQQFLDVFKRLLSNEIAGREELEVWLRPGVPGRTVLFSCTLPIQTDDGLSDRKYKVHADCTCAAAAAFIKQATIHNLTLGQGKKGGQRVAVDGVVPEGLNIYWDP